MALITEINNTTPSEHWLEALADGTHVLVRSISAHDHDRLLTFFQRLSPPSIRFRFLGAVTHVDERIIDAFLNVATEDCMGYVALIHNFGELQIIGICRFKRLEDKQDCGCTVAVADAWQRKGLGRILLAHLIAAPRRNGYEHMRSIDLSTDYSVHRLSKHAGFTSVYMGHEFYRIHPNLQL